MAVLLEVGAGGVLVVVGRGVAVSVVGVGDSVGGNRVGVEGMVVAVGRAGNRSSSCHLDGENHADDHQNEDDSAQNDPHDQGDSIFLPQMRFSTMYPA